MKVSIQPQAQSVSLGGQVQMKCVLQDAINRTAVAPKDMTIQVEAKWPSGKTEQLSVIIKQGTSSGELTVPAGESGIAEVQARQRELLNGSTFIKIRPARTQTRAPVSTATTPVFRTVAPETSAVMPPGSPAPAPRAESPAPRTVTGTSPVRPARRPAVERVVTAEAKSPATTAKPGPKPVGPPAGALAPAPPPPPASDKAGLVLLPEARKFLADGKDKATITAFLDDDAGGGSDSNIQVNLFADKGRLNPVPLVIARGDDVAKAELTSDQVGTVTVRFVNSRPQLELRSAKELKIAFAPPITAIEIHPSPPKLTLLEKGELILKLVDANGKPEVSDEPRKVDLEIKSGNATVSPTAVTIEANSSSARVTFEPRQRGVVTIEAFTPNLLAAATAVTVTFPLMLIACSLVGSGLGGGLASSLTDTRRRQKRGWYLRVLVGLVTGFVLYYFGILGFITVFPTSVALNPFGAGVLSLIGGWMGTEVLTLVLKWLGLGKEKSD